jgi:hypothetical protein
MIWKVTHSKPAVFRRGRICDGLKKEILENQKASAVYDDRGFRMQERVLPSRFIGELRVTPWVICLVQDHSSFLRGGDPKTT